MGVKEKGTFYGVSVGPGDPSLLTLQAMDVLRRCTVIAAPRTAGGGITALEIVRAVIDLKGKEILPLAFPMSGDPEERAASHRSAVDAILPFLEQGRDVAMINLGDGSLYASVSYLLEPIRQAGYPVQCVPGVTSFSAASAALGVALAEGETPVHIIPSLSCQWKESLDLPGTKVLMKAGGRLPEIYAYLKETGRLRCSSLAVNCGMEREILISPFTELPDAPGYFTLVIVKE